MSATTGRRAWLEPTIWAALWLAEAAFTRRWQPSWAMTAIAVTALLGASAALLHLSPRIAGKGASVTRRALGLGLATLVLGGAAAVAIRIAYLMLAPDITPFGMAFNIATDSAWVAVHAAIVGAALRLFGRK